MLSIGSVAGGNNSDDIRNRSSRVWRAKFFDVTFTTQSKPAARARTLCAGFRVRIITKRTVELRAGSATVLEQEVEPTSWLKVVECELLLILRG